MASLARPGGNATGLTNITEELSGKRLELLIEALPIVSHVAALWFTSGAPTDKIPIDETLAASRPMKVRIQVLQVHEPVEFDGLFATARKDGATAMTVLRSPFFFLHSKTLVDLAIKYRLPAIYEPGSFVELGGLMSYGANSLDMYRHVATLRTTITTTTTNVPEPSALLLFGSGLIVVSGISRRINRRRN